MSENNRTCPFCAEEVRGDEAVCPHCGSKIGETTKSPVTEHALAGAAQGGVPQSRRLSKANLALIIGAAVVVIGGGAAAAIFVANAETEDDAPATAPALTGDRERSAPASPGEKDGDATIAALGNTTYRFSVMGDGDETFILKDGRFSADGGATVTLAPKHQQVADVDGDGFKEAVGILEYGIGAGSIYGVLVVVDGPDSNPKQKAAAVLGDRELIERVQPDGDRIALDMVVHTESDPECCPSLRTTLRYRLRGSELVADATTAGSGGGSGSGSDFLSGLPQPSDPVTDSAGAREHLKKGRLLERDGQHDAAIAEYVEALRLSPTMPTPGKEGSVWGELGYVLMNAARYDDAEAVCKRALDVGGDGKFRSAVNYNLGTIAKKTGRTQDAVRYFEASVAANPGNKVAAAKLAELRGN